MDFKFEDILKNIFPGILLMAAVHFAYTSEMPFHNWNNPFPQTWKDFSGILLTVILMIAYIIGYFNDMIASWFEDYILFNITSKPTFLLLTEKTQRIVLNNPNEIFHKLKTKCSEHPFPENVTSITKKDALRIFEAAKSITESNVSDYAKEKLDILYRTLNFSRNLLFALAILAILTTIKIWIVYGFMKFLIATAVFIGILIISFFRWKERGLYYSRLILNIANNTI